MGQIHFIVGIMSIVLFSLAIIGFAINFASDNNAEISLSDDPEITTLRSNLEANASNLRSSSQESYQSIVKSSVEQGETIESGGVFSLTITNAIPTFFNILRVGYVKIFGAKAGFGVFLTALITIIGFIGFMYFVKTWLGRNPE